MNRANQYLCLAWLTLTLVSPVPQAKSAEFDATRFPSRNEAEVEFRRALALSNAAPAEALSIYEELLHNKDVPADEVHWALAGLLEGAREEQSLRAVVDDPSSPLRSEALERLAELAESLGQGSEPASR